MLTWALPTPPQVLAELRDLVAYRGRYLGPGAAPLLALGLSSRKNLCVNPKVAGVHAGGRGVRAEGAACWYVGRF